MFGKKMILLFLCLALLLTGCGAAVSNDAAIDFGGPQAQAPMDGGAVYGEVSMESAAGSMTVEQKLIKRVTLDTETEDLDTMLTEVGKKVDFLQGYIESRQVYNGSAYAGRRVRNAELVIRIPADRLNEFVTHVEGVSNVVSMNESQDDITLQYVDTESRMKALQAEQERLLELMDQAEDMTSLLQIEERLTQVRYELESVTSQLRVYDNLVDYATVTLYISEVVEYTPVAEETIWDRIGRGFSESWADIGSGAGDILVWLLAGSPYLLLLAVPVVIVVIIVKSVRKKRRNAQPPAEE